MKTPQRIQRKRAKGWRMPPNTVCVTRPSKWGNPFRIEPGVMSRKESVEHFRTFAEGFTESELNELRGKNLACFCNFDGPCHADVLLELSNKEEEKD